METRTVPVLLECSECHAHFTVQLNVPMRVTELNRLLTGVCFSCGKDKTLVFVPETRPFALEDLLSERDSEREIWKQAEGDLPFGLED